MRLDQKIRQVNKGYYKAHEYANGYKFTNDDDVVETRIGKWFTNADMLKEWQPFYRTITGEESTLFILEIDMREAYMHINGVDISKAISDPAVLRELKLTAGLDFVRKFQQLYPKNEFFIQCSGQGYHLMQEYKGYIDPKRFIDVVRALLHGHAWKEGSVDFSKEFECKTTHGDVKYTAFVDKAPYKYGLIRWTYSPYWKIPDYEFYSIPIKDDYTIETILERTRKENLSIEPYYIPEFQFEELLSKEDVHHVPSFIQKKKRLKTARVYRDEEIIIPATEDELRTHHMLKLKEMQNRLMADWTQMAPAIKDTYIKVCTESGHYRLRVVLMNALAHMGYTIEDVALFFRFNINDESDNTNPEKLFEQLKYWFYDKETGEPVKFTFNCKTLQDKDSPWFSCDISKPCGRNYCFNKPFDISVHKTDDDFNAIFNIAEFILSSESHNLIELAKTTRSGVTTSLIIKGAELNKTVLALFPTKRICDDTYPDAVNIGLHREPSIEINGSVLRANKGACIKLQEQLNRHPFLRHLGYISKPKCIGKSICKYWNMTYGTPFYRNDRLLPVGSLDSLEPDMCTMATIFQHPEMFESVAMTYAKMRMVLETNKEEAIMLRDYLNTVDVIILDEFSRFSADATRLMIREEKVDWATSDYLQRKHDFSIFNQLQEELFILENIEWGGEFVETIIELINRFIEAFTNLHVPKFEIHSPEASGLIEVNNPLSQKQRVILNTKGMQFHGIIEKIARENLYSLTTIEKVLNFLKHENWIATNITSEFTPLQYIFIAKPSNETFIEWVREMALRGTKVITTDATLPMLSSTRIFELDFKREDAGDPTGNNNQQLIIADSRKIGVIELTRKRELQSQLVDYINKVVDMHGVENVMVVTPNTNSAQMLEYYIKKGSLKPVELTYFRSNLTIGVKSSKRVMVIVGAPFTPHGSHLSFSYYQINKFRQEKWLRGLSHKQKIYTLSEELRAHAMSSAFYQTIGRAKDPIGRDRSIVYCWGLNRSTLQDMFIRIKENTVVPLIYETYVRFNRDFHVYVGNKWMEEGKYIEPIIGKTIDYGFNYMRKGDTINTRDIWKRMNASTLYGIGYNQFHDILWLHREELMKYYFIDKTNGKKSFKLIKFV